MKTIPVKEIKLTRLDGTRNERKEPVILKAAGETSAYQVASQFLQMAAMTAPTNGSHIVTFDVAFEDGEVYSGDIELQYNHSKTGYDIAVHIRNFAETYSGKKRPGHLSQEQYEEGLKKVPAAQRKQYERLLTKGYDLTPTPKVEDDAPAIKGSAREWRFSHLAIRPEAERTPIADPNDMSIPDDGTFLPNPTPPPAPIAEVEKPGNRTILGPLPIFMKPAKA